MREGSAIEISRWTPDTPILFGAICILGRGIEQVRTNAGVVWRPTRYIEQPTAEGAHSGWRRRASLNDDCSIIAGANANVIGGCELFKNSLGSDIRARLVVFAAGRPSYLAEEPDPTLTEGRILMDKFVRKVRPSSDVEIVVLARNRNTRDDIDETIRLAADRQITRVGIVTVDVHLNRTIEFARRAVWVGNPVRLVFVGAEELLARRYNKRSKLLAIHSRIQETAAYRRTLSREENGVLALREGRYVRT